MNPLVSQLAHRRPPVIAATLPAAVLLVLARRGGAATVAPVANSLPMFGGCRAGAAHLPGPGAALRLVAIATGWRAERPGSSYGWFFGSCTYTPVLGPRLLDVPVVPTVEPLMDETRPLKLPDALPGDVGAPVDAWHNDAGAPRRANALERRFTGRARPARQG